MLEDLSWVEEEEEEEDLSLSFLVLLVVMNCERGVRLGRVVLREI